MEKGDAEYRVNITLPEIEFNQAIANAKNEDHNQWITNRQQDTENRLRECRFCHQESNSFDENDQHMRVGCNNPDTGLHKA